MTTLCGNTSHSGRLDGTFHLSCHVSLQELQQVNRKSKVSCLGPSCTDKMILSHLPERAWTQLRGILSPALFARYFPDCFKEAEMRMLVKLGKALTHPDKYGPISPLEVSGKLFKRMLMRHLQNYLK